MIIKILFTILVLAINYILYRKFNRQEIKLHFIVIALGYGVTVATVNFIVNVLPKQLIFFLLMFSASIIIMNVMMRSSKVMQRSNLPDIEQIQKVKDFLLNKIFICLITIFQVLLIWSPVMFNNMIHKK
jgi:hypothetical protein